MLILAGMFTVSHAADVYDVNTAPQTAPAGYYDHNAQDPTQAVQQIPEGANVVRTTEYQRDPNTVTTLHLHRAHSKHVEFESSSDYRHQTQI